MVFCWQLFVDLSDCRMYSGNGIPCGIRPSDIEASLRIHQIDDQDLVRFMYRAIREMDSRWIVSEMNKLKNNGNARSRNR